VNDVGAACYIPLSGNGGGTVARGVTSAGGTVGAVAFFSSPTTPAPSPRCGWRVADKAVDGMRCCDALAVAALCGLLLEHCSSRYKASSAMAFVCSVTSFFERLRATPPAAAAALLSL